MSRSGLGEEEQDWRAGLFARRSMGIRLGLEAIRRVDRALGHPASDAPVVHVVGTNGKGSTAAMVELGLRRLGWRTGLFTSPHLERVGERIRIDGVPVHDDVVREAVARVEAAEAGAGARLSFFELLTVAALQIFAEARVGRLVLEAGLGGRLDATRIRAPWHTLITRVGLDHQRFLGPRHVDITREKAAVIHRGVPVSSQHQRPDVAAVLRAQAHRVGAPLGFVSPTGRAPEGLGGEHQRHNAGLALACLRRLAPAADLALIDGVRWPGRLERRPFGGGELVLDVAHNLDGVEALRVALEGDRIALLVFGCQADKDGAGMAAALPEAATRWWVALEPGQAPPAGFAARGVAEDPGAPELRAAIEAALRGGGRVLVCGSHLLVGALGGLLREGLVPRDIALGDPRDAAGSADDLERPGRAR